MIERKFIKSIIKENEIQEFVKQSLKNSGLSHVKLQRTPLGEKVIIYASKPGLIVGRKGQNIKNLTDTLKKDFNLENPQIEVNEVQNSMLDPMIVAEKIAASLERFGTQRFKGIGHKMITSVMDAGALGVEIIISGKIPSSRAKSWRFYMGYLKKSGDIAITGVKKAQAQAVLKLGVVGVKVSIMPGDIRLPDHVELLEKPIVEEEVKDLKESKEKSKIKENEDEKVEKTNKTEKKAKSEVTEKKETKAKSEKKESKKEKSEIGNKSENKSESKSKEE